MHRPTPVTRLLVVASAALVATTACGGDATGPHSLEPAASIAISALPETLLTRQQVSLTATARNLHGVPLLDRPVTWSSSDPSIASVSPAGRLQAIAPGTTTIRVAIDDLADSARVTVAELQLAKVIAGPSMACGLDGEGQAWCWGHAGTGGSGNGTLDTSVVNVPVRSAVGHAFSALALAVGSACGLEASGQVLCWGRNDLGQLGDGTTAPRGTPAPVATISDIVQVVAGTDHFCARSSAGAVWCWGSDEALQTGDPSRGASRSPYHVPLAGAAADIGAGAQHSCALVGSRAYCWGSDRSRQLGHDTTYDRLTPTRAGTGDGTARSWVEVDASNAHTCARDAGGAMACWGLLEGQNDNDAEAWSPTARLPDVTATAISGGWFVQCAVSAAQEAWCTGTTYPATRLAAARPVSAVAAAADYPCVLETDGTVECAAAFYQHDAAMTQVPLPAPAVSLAAADLNVCAVLDTGATYCWPGWSTPAPVRVFNALSATGVFGNSGRRLCITTSSDTVSCWDGSVETLEPTGGLAFSALAVGDDHTCGLTAAGAAWCWGQNTHGKLGDGSATDRAAPVQVVGGHVFTGIAAGWEHSCGVTGAGELYCWGRTSYGEFGLGTHGDESAAAVTVDGAPGLAAIAANVYSGCGLDAAGNSWCWPVRPDSGGVAAVAGATGLARLVSGPCGLQASGALLCWGDNYNGRFGNGTFNTSSASATPSGNGLLFNEISMSLYGTACGISLDGAAYCWGSGSTYGGALGSPDATGEIATIPLKLYGSP